MKKSILYILSAMIILFAGGFFLFSGYFDNQKQENKEYSTQPTYKDIAYEIDGKQVLLKGGYSETEILRGSASKVITRYFGNEAEGDLNGDGIFDIVFLLTQDMGGSGTFFYVVVALKTDKGYKGMNAVLLGDRVSPQTTEIRNGEVIVNYAVRKEGEPMTTQPSIGVSKYLKVFWGTLNEIQKKDNLIRVFSPSAGEEINSPLVVKGEARGYWFFEADFSIVLVDWDGRIIAQSYATAKDNWMTENFIPFEGLLEFKKPFDSSLDIPDFMKWGALIFKKNNPSGLPEHDDAIEVPIRFNPL